MLEIQAPIVLTQEYSVDGSSALLAMETDGRASRHSIAANDGEKYSESENTASETTDDDRESGNLESLQLVTQVDNS